MKYIERVGDNEIIYEGTPEEIASAKHLIDNELISIDKEGMAQTINIEMNGISEDEECVVKEVVGALNRYGGNLVRWNDE